MIPCCLCWLPVNLIDACRLILSLCHEFVEANMVPSDQILLLAGVLSQSRKAIIQLFSLGTTPVRGIRYVPLILGRVHIFSRLIGPTETQQGILLLI